MRRSPGIGGRFMARGSNARILGRSGSGSLAGPALRHRPQPAAGQDAARSPLRRHRIPQSPRTRGDLGAPPSFPIEVEPAGLDVSDLIWYDAGYPGDFPPNRPADYTRVAVRLSGGQAGVTYHVKVRVATSHGQVLESCGVVRVAQC